MKLIAMKAIPNLLVVGMITASSFALGTPPVQAQEIWPGLVGGLMGGLIGGAVRSGGDQGHQPASNQSLAAYGLVGTECGPAVVQITFRRGRKIACAVATPNYPPGTYKEMDGGDLKPYGISVGTANPGPSQMPMNVINTPGPSYPGGYPNPYLGGQPGGGGQFMTPPPSGNPYAYPGSTMVQPGMYPPPAPGMYQSPFPSMPPTTFPPVLLTHNPAQPINPTDAMRIQASLSAQGLAPAPCSATPGSLVVITMGPYTACAFPSANFTAGNYRGNPPIGLTSAGF